MEQGVAQLSGGGDDRLGTLDGVVNGVQHGGDGPLLRQGWDGQHKVCDIRRTDSRICLTGRSLLKIVRELLGHHMMVDVRPVNVRHRGKHGKPSRSNQILGSLADTSETPKIGTNRTYKYVSRVYPTARTTRSLRSR